MKRASSSALSRSSPALACSCVESARQLLGEREPAGEIRMGLDQRALGARRCPCAIAAAIALASPSALSSALVRPAS